MTLSNKIDALMFTHDVFDVVVSNGAVVSPAPNEEAAQLLREITPFLVKYYGRNTCVRLQEIAARLAGYPTRKPRPRYR